MREKEDFSLTLQKLLRILSFISHFNIHYLLSKPDIVAAILSDNNDELALSNHTDSWYLVHTAAHSCQLTELRISLRISPTPFSHRAVSLGLSEQIISVLDCLLLFVLTPKITLTPFLT